MFDPRYEDQVRLLLRCLPMVAAQDCFALKGGSAINLFVRDMPRLSVDIDLTYLPIEPRTESLKGIESGLVGIQESVVHNLGDAKVEPIRIHGRVAKLDVFGATSQIRIEPNLILRGVLGNAAPRDLCAAAQNHFARFASAAVVPEPDLYAGKLCAALDRQHPRDLFDVKLLIDDTGITPEIRRGFVVYLAACNRPMNELLAPRLNNIADAYNSEFQGMARIELPLSDLEAVQRDLAPTLVNSLDADERQFLLSMKAGDPDWDILGFRNLQAMPALQWKLINIRRMEAAKRAEQLQALKEILEPR